MACCVTFGYPTGRWGVAAREPAHEVSYRNQWGTPVGFEIPEPLWPPSASDAIPELASSAWPIPTRATQVGGRGAKWGSRGDGPALRKRIVDLELSDDQELLRETTARFIETKCPLPRVRELIDDPIGHDRTVVHDAGDLGWFALFVPEEFGGGQCVGRTAHGRGDRRRGARPRPAARAVRRHQRRCRRAGARRRRQATGRIPLEPRVGGNHGDLGDRRARRSPRSRLGGRDRTRRRLHARRCWRARPRFGCARPVAGERTRRGAGHAVPRAGGRARCGRSSSSPVSI